jgi:glycosyltransferase involved in cell wall biosynthesis
MNIVLVNIWLDAARGTGTAERTRRLAGALADLGCKCSVVTMGQSAWHAELATAGVTVHTLSHLGRRYTLPLPRPRALWRLVRDADVVCVTGYWYLLAPLAAWLAHLAGTPFVICPAGELLAFDGAGALKALYRRLVGHRMLTAAAAIVAITPRECDDLVARFAVDRRRVLIAPNGVPASAPAESPLPELSGASFILFVGRLAPVKGVDMLIEAFAEIAGVCPDVDLVLAGPDFGMGAQLHQRVAAIGLTQRVHFLGFVDEGQRQQLYRRALLLAVPSRSEVMSIVALEAAAAGTPVLLTRSCGFDAVAESGGGRVVDAEPHAIAAGLKTMLADRAALAPMGQRLRAFALQHHSWAATARGLRDHLAGVIAKGRRPDRPIRDGAG